MLCSEEKLYEEKLCKNSGAGREVFLCMLGRQVRFREWLAVFGTFRIEAGTIG